MAPSQLLPSARVSSSMVASCVLLLTLVFLSETALSMRPLSETTIGAGKTTLAQPALQGATIFRTRSGAERRLLANSFVEATDAVGLATTLVGANSLLTVDAASVVYTGATSASGIFQLDASHALNSEYGISNGVVLTCGSGELSIVTENLASSSSTNNGEPGDALLTEISNGATNDASVLDFKGTAQGNGQLTFQYVFGSEEYLEFVGDFNDIFALFVKVGDGAFTPSDNVALASNGQAVSINNVNPDSNAAQYVDNPAGSGTHPIAYDGYTTLLTTAPISVSTGDTVHIRLAIADAVDLNLDSVVYVVGKSIVIAPTPAPTTPSPAPTTPAPTTPAPTTPVPTTPAPTTPASTPGPISKCSDTCNPAGSAPNRCCNAEGSLGICCPGLCGLSTPNPDGTTNPTCLGAGGATPAPVPTTPTPTTSAPTTPAPTTAAPTTPAPTTSAPTTPAPTTSAPTTPAPTTSAPTTPAPTTPGPTTAPTPAPTGPLQSCTNDFCDPFGPLPNKCCNAPGVTMRCCPGQCGPNTLVDGVSTPTCM